MAYAVFLCEHHGLVSDLAEFAADRSVITALWPESRRGSPNMKAFVAFFGEVFTLNRPGFPGGSDL